MRDLEHAAQNSIADEIRARHPGDGYIGFHAERYALVLELIDSLDLGPSPRILDVGPSTLTGLISERTSRHVDTLGFGNDGASRGGGQHYQYDLNDSQWRERWRTDLPAYELVVMAEVIEHLYASPTHVLAFIKTLLRPGGVLLLQTPNAAALPKRIKLLMGRNPYNLINEDHSNPLHFREYTEKELLGYADAAGFVVLARSFGSYFDQRFGWHTGSRKSAWIGAIQNVVYRHLPRHLRIGMTITLRRPTS